jgi:hypothetical protein
MWCSFPDDECVGGRRWANLDVGDGLAGACVGGEDPDGGMPDANPNGPWLRTAGSNVEDKVNGMAVDGQGNIYVVGSFEQTFVAQSSVLVSAGGTDGFALKYSPSGELVWSRKFGGGGQDAIADVALAPDGSPIVVGAFSGTVDFGGVSRTSMGGRDQFIAKLGSADGATTWVTRQGAANEEIPSDVAVSDDGSIATIGLFEIQTNLGGSNLTDVSSALGTVYVAKFRESDGTHVWSRAFGGSGFDNRAGDVAFLGSTVYVTGAFSGTGDIGEGSITAMGPSDAFVTVLEGSDGSTERSLRWGGDGLDEARAIALQESPPRIYLTGFYNGPSSFGGTTLPGLNNAFVAAYLHDGSHVWSKDLGNAAGSAEEGATISLGSAGSILLGVTLEGVTVVGTETIMPTGRDGAAVLLDAATGTPSRAFPIGMSGDQTVEAVRVQSGRLVVAGHFVGAVGGFGTSGSGTGAQDVYVGSVPLP